MFCFLAVTNHAPRNILAQSPGADGLKSPEKDRSESLGLAPLRIYQITPGCLPKGSRQVAQRRSHQFLEILFGSFSDLLRLCLQSLVPKSHVRSPPCLFLESDQTNFFHIRPLIPLCRQPPGVAWAQRGCHGSRVPARGALTPRGLGDSLGEMFLLPDVPPSCLASVDAPRGICVCFSEAYRKPF